MNLKSILCRLQLLVLLFSFNEALQAQDLNIRINLTGASPNISYQKYKVKKYSPYAVHITYDADNYELTVNQKKKKITYTSVAKAALSGLTNANTTVVSNYIMNSDAIEFTISISPEEDENLPEYETSFIIYAQDYFTVYPITGFSFQKFNNQNTFYYEPEINGNAINSDDFYTYRLKKEAVGTNINIYVGTNINYLFNDWFNAGFSISIGLNTNKSSVSSLLLGGNAGFGRKVQFTFGAGLALAKIKSISDTYFQQEIRAKFSSPPKVPEGVENWKSGFYLNFGIAVKILENI